MCRECQTPVVALQKRRMIADTWFLMIVDVHNLSDKINEGLSIKMFFFPDREFNHLSMTTCLWISQNVVWQMFRLLSALWQLYNVEEVRNKPKTGFCKCPAIQLTKVFSNSISGWAKNNMFTHHVTLIWSDSDLATRFERVLVRFRSREHLSWICL